MCFLTCFSYLGTCNVQDVVIHHVGKGDRAQLLGDHIAASFSASFSSVFLHKLEYFQDNLK